MLVTPSNIYLHMDVVDYHNSTYGLTVVVELGIKLKPVRDKVKILY